MGKDKRPSPEEMLVAAATDIHNDNCTLMARLDDPDFDPATGLDCTLNGALRHILDFFGCLQLFPQGFVPYEKVDFMVESTNALISAVERRYRLASAHKAGQAFRASLRWWHTPNEFHTMPPEAYKKRLIDSRECFIAALHEFNCELFRGAIPQPAPANPPPARCGSPTARAGLWLRVAGGGNWSTIGTHLAHFARMAESSNGSGFRQKENAK